jgi:hypothetical protein
VKPPHGYPDNYLFGEPLYHNSFLRLENRASGKTLHSHVTHPSPISGQGEVTCYDQDDLNNNWQLITGEKIELQMKTVFRLFHTTTSYALHSHPASDPKVIFGQQEVTGYTGRDYNDEWIIEAVSGPIVLPKISSEGKGAIWLAIINLLGSIASLTGITLLFLGVSIRTAGLAQVLATALASTFTLGVLVTIFLCLLRAHQFLRLKLRTTAAIVAMWMTVGVLGLVGSVYLWFWISKYASLQVAQVLRDAFGWK